MAHGVRKHMARGACHIKVAFTTYAAALAATVNIKDAERPYRGKCCGYYHITSMTEAEFSQAMATRGVQDSAIRGKVDLTDEEYLALMEKEREEQEARAARPEAAEPGAGPGGPGAATFKRGPSVGRTPTPAALARRLQARRDS